MMRCQRKSWIRDFWWSVFRQNRHCSGFPRNTKGNGFWLWTTMAMVLDWSNMIEFKSPDLRPTSLIVGGLEWRWKGRARKLQGQWFWALDLQWQWCMDGIKHRQSLRVWISTDRPVVGDWNGRWKATS